MTQSASPSAADGTSDEEQSLAQFRQKGTLTEPRDPRRYQVLGEHGRGGLGRVSRAHDHDLGRDIAIKELISRGKISDVRFLREALITARLEHPGIVPIYEAGRWPDGAPFYAMKLVAGKPLRELIAERRTIAERIGLLHHVIAVADAIAYAHGRHIIHRDLKPSNVIVGDFGETVVIDWGLAKDLSVADDKTFVVTTQVSPDKSDLTATGTVLGTPAYMPPEQERGEQVDQRADVFAIGAMLWEICALEKVPPTQLHLRHRLLRRAGIDKDLVSIIDKALDPEPTRRYSDAGALATDLKAFKAGARIAARSYSPAEALARWARRHRRLAWAAVVMFGLAITTAIFYVHGITRERDRADLSEKAAKRASDSAREALDALTLNHAELLLQSDPTTAVSTLAEYRGSDAMRHMQLLAEATGRGVARSVLHPHNDTIYLLAGRADGSIISIGEDHRVRRTIDHTTTTLDADVSYVVVYAYSPVGGLVAYATSLHDIAIMNVNLGRNAFRIPRRGLPNLLSMSLTANGDRLAALDKSGHLTVWSLASEPVESHHDIYPDAQEISFVGPTQIAVLGRTGIQLLDLMGLRARKSSIVPSSFHSNGTEILIGSSDGELVLMSLDLEEIARTKACTGAISSVAQVPNGDLVVYACPERKVGIARIERPSRTFLETGGFKTTAAVSSLTVDDAGTYVLATCGRDTFVHYLSSGITAHLQGQAARISAIAASTRDYRGVLTGDVNGTLRIWDLLEPKARVLAHVQGLTLGARFSPDSRQLAVFGTDRSIHVVDLEKGTIKELRGHTDSVGGVRYSADGNRLLSFSWDGTARIWQTSTGLTSRTFVAHNSLVQSGELIEEGRLAVTVGDDGHAYAWGDGNNDAIALLTHDRPLISLQAVGSSDNLVVQDSMGALWLLGPGLAPQQIRQADDAEVTILRASKDRRFLAVGQDSGKTTIYRTADWGVAATFSESGSVARIDFDPRDRDVLVQSEDGFVHVHPLLAGRSMPWQSFQTKAHDITYAPDGELIAITTLDGGTWFYSAPTAQWSYAHDHDTEVWSGRFSPNGKVFVSIDRGGAVVIRNVRDITLPSRHHAHEPSRPGDRQ